MKVLQLCNKPPYPPIDGGAIGMNNVTQGLLDENNEVKVIAFNSAKHNSSYNELPEDYIKNTSIEFFNIDTDIKVKDALVNLFSKKSYNIERFYHNSVANRLKEYLINNSYDIIQIESIFLIYYLELIRSHSKAKIVLRAPNVEYKIWERMSAKESNPVKRLYLKFLAHRLKKAEFHYIRKVDAIYTVTPEDQHIFETMGAKCPITYIPTGIDVTKQADTGISCEHPSIFHIGAMDWMPNQEGMDWFLKEVWPELHQRRSDLNFYFAGRRMPEHYFNGKWPNVHCLGEVEDASAFIQSKSIMIVPLFSGSGMRVKIIEGMMLKKAIVSTTIGIEGIIHKDGEDVLIANNKDEFIKAIERLVDNNDLYHTICNNAQKKSEQNYNNKELGRKLHDFLSRLL